VVGTLLNIISERRITKLRIQQRGLINEWGKDVAVSPEVDKNSDHGPLEKELIAK
jgi:hypothetical protein